MFKLNSVVSFKTVNSQKIVIECIASVKSEQTYLSSKLIGNPFLNKFLKSNKLYNSSLQSVTIC